MVIYQSDHVQVSLHQEELTLVFDVANPKGNVLARQTLTDLGHALTKIAASPAKGLTVRSANQGLFSKGWDWDEVRALATPDARRLFAELGQTVGNQLAQLPMPTVAVITGPCLGGGLELALACDYRLVVDRPHVQLSLTQVKLGLLPTWGGTQRLPRVIGLENALPLLLTGKQISPAQALKLGLVDVVTPANPESPWPLLPPPRKRSWGRLPGRTVRQKVMESHRLGRWLIFRGTARLLEQRLPEDFPAPAEILDAVRVGLDQGWEAGLQRESQAFVRLAETEAAANLVKAAVTPFPSLKPSVAAARFPPLRRVGIVGSDSTAGLLTRLVVTKGSQVMLREPDGAALGFALLRMVGLFQTAVEEGYLPANVMARKLNSIRATTKWDGFGDLDLVLVTLASAGANLPALFQELEKHTSTETILVATDVCVRIQDLQEHMKFPERCAGLNFLQLEDREGLIELAPGTATSAATVSALTHWFAGVGKTLILVKDCPGRLVGRCLFPYLNEAVQLVSEGIQPARIDEAMERFGMVRGPLAYLDQLGLDGVSTIAACLERDLAERFVWHPLFTAMQEKGWRGQMPGRGFYHYRRHKRRPHSALLALVAEQEGPSPAAGLARADLLQGIQRRLVALLVNEAARALEEKVVANAEVLDRAMVMTNFWPSHRGGPLRYGQYRGYRTVVADLRELAEVFGCRYEPCAGLKQLAAAEGGEEGSLGS